MATVGEGESQAEKRACAKALWQEQMAHRGQVRVERPLGLKQEGLMISPRL